MAKEKKHGKAKKLPLDYIPNISNVVSSGECTGVVPTQPQNQDELESYLSLSSTSLPPVWEDEEP